jgi:hypothetical protein
MSESFVDLTYRGLSLGRRLKLSDMRPTTGYVETPAPMPVGTQIGIAGEDSVALDAVVVEVHEQVAGSDRTPGMVVRPRLDGEVAKEWWHKRVTKPEVETKPAPAPAPAPAAAVAAAAAQAPVVVMGKRMTNPGFGVPEVMDDGRDTGVMDAIDLPAVDAAPAIQDDGRQTIAMDAVDLKALGLTTSSSEMPAVKVEGEDDEPNPVTGDDKPSEGKSKRRRKRR